MAIGPVQLLALGFTNPTFKGEILAECERLRDTDTIRVIDAVIVYKDAEGRVEAEHLGNLSEAESIELDSKIGALVGLGFAGVEGAVVGAEVGKEYAESGAHLLDDMEGWDVLGDIPNDSAAALLLIEHHWAVGLRDAIARAGGFRVGDTFISPFDLLEVGLIAADEAARLEELETTGAAPA